MLKIIRNGFIISTSSYWLILFFIIYIIPLLYSDGFTLLGNIMPETLEKMEQISLLAILSFIISNTIFLRKTASSKEVLSTRQSTITFKRLYNAWLFILAILSLLIVYFASTISLGALISEGAKLLIEADSDSSFIPIEICIICLNFISILMFEEAHTVKQKIIMFACIVISLILSSTFVFARRIVIFPIVIVWALHYMRSKNKKSLLLFTIPFVLALIIIMIVMMSARTFGINNAISSLISLSDMGGSLEAVQYFASATDFAFNFNYLAVQLQTDNVSVTPLTYLKPLFLLIPRSLWPGKPEAFCVLIMRELGVNLDVANFSAGTGLIGEALATLGIAGIIIIPSLWGIICGFLDTHIYRRYIHKGVLSQITVGIFAYLFFMIQTITGAHRGDTGNAVIEFIIDIVPLLILLKIFCIRGIRKQNILVEKSKDDFCER